DLRAGSQRRGDLHRALVYARAREGATRVLGRDVLAHDRLARPARKVVAFHDADPEGSQPQLAREALDRARGPARIRGAEIADDGNAVRDAIGEDRAKLHLEERLVALVGVALAFELRDG